MVMGIPDIITDVIKSIMPINWTTHLNRNWQFITRILIGVSLGVSLLWLSIPRTMAAFLNLPGDPVLENIQLGKPVTIDDLNNFVSSRKNSLEWVESGRTWTDLGLAYLQLAKQVGYDTEEGTEYTAKSAQALKAGLSLAPASPYAWARLAFLGLQPQNYGIDAKHALIMSLLTGPFERRLASTRIQYALALWDKLEARQQKMIYGQIVFLDRFSRGRLLKLARRNRKSRTIVLTALAKAPERQESFRLALAK